ncbi:MAG: DUF92 domain-containing protein [Acidobacteria bacterium]|nr:DUF92 domain-containing protein [Acidobacteriota bacterium]
MIENMSVTGVSALFLGATAGEKWFRALITALFAAFAWAVRGVTLSGAIAGAIIGLLLIMGAGWSGFAGLAAVFLLTWGATRLGYRRKQRLGTAEASSGRDAAQVFSNLGVAAACAGCYLWLWQSAHLLLALAAALTEAGADTVAGEIGQALGGTPRLVTSWQPVPAGTDGGITVGGTLAGIASAIVLSLVAAATGLIGFHSLVICAVAGVMGSMADSILGATLERGGILRNNAVNFVSTLVAAGIAFMIP